MSYSCHVALDNTAYAVVINCRFLVGSNCNSCTKALHEVNVIVVGISSHYNQRGFSCSRFASMRAKNRTTQASTMHTNGSLL